MSVIWSITFIYVCEWVNDGCGEFAIAMPDRMSESRIESHFPSFLSLLKIMSHSSIWKKNVVSTYRKDMSRYDRPIYLFVSDPFTLLTKMSYFEYKAALSIIFVNKCFPQRRILLFLGLFSISIHFQYCFDDEIRLISFFIRKMSPVLGLNRIAAQNRGKK